MEENTLTEVLVEPMNYEVYKKEQTSKFCIKCIISLVLFASICFTFLIIMYILERPYVDESLKSIYDQQIISLMILSSTNNFITFCIYLFSIYKK